MPLAAKGSHPPWQGGRDAHGGVPEGLLSASPMGLGALLVQRGI